MTSMAHRVQQFGTTIFTEMTALARKHEAINLGQGFPDFPAPDFIKEAAKEAISAEFNQYAPAQGYPILRQAIADKMNQHYDFDVAPNHVNVTHGATEAIFATIMGLVDPGDEVIVFEPYYDSYIPAIQFAGGVPRYYTLRAPNWSVDGAELAALFSEKTKLIMINTPHNPTGKVFSRPELELIAQLCIEHDVIAVTDEVYEHIIFDGVEHVCMATLPGMRDRTVTISSAGKTFSVTGWKIGWTIASPDLGTGIFRARQFMTFSIGSPAQQAVAAAMKWADETGYYGDLSADYQRKRNILIDALKQAGLPPITPQGTYFAMADISQLGFENDVAFCRHLTKEIGVAAIPPSAFYSNPADGAGIARFAFCKQDQSLHAAAERLSAANFS